VFRRGLFLRSDAVCRGRGKCRSGLAAMKGNFLLWRFTVLIDGRVGYGFAAICGYAYQKRNSQSSLGPEDAFQNGQGHCRHAASLFTWHSWELLKVSNYPFRVCGLDTRTIMNPFGKLMEWTMLYRVDILVIENSQRYCTCISSRRGRFPCCQRSYILKLLLGVYYNFC
jgi:hypothetical protein